MVVVPSHGKTVFISEEADYSEDVEEEIEFKLFSISESFGHGMIRWAEAVKWFPVNIVDYSVGGFASWDVVVEKLGDFYAIVRCEDLEGDYDVDMLGRPPASSRVDPDPRYLRHYLDTL